ncbi:hypothetical protein D3C85_1729020 [compost metagenome]
MSVDPAHYRDPAEVALALLSDPITRARELLAADGQADAAAEVLAQARAEIAAAVAVAKAAPFPAAHEAFEDIATTGQGVWA